MTPSTVEQPLTAREGLDTVPVYNLEGKPTREIKLPAVFQTPVRPDIIKRAVLAVQSTRFQPKGRDPRAGRKSSAVSLGTGLGIARVPRIKGHGYPKAGQAAMIHSAVGGRVAHPPKIEKIILKRINKKEKRFAMKAALGATADREAVTKRGHRLGEVKALPIIVEDDIEGLKTTKTVNAAFRALGLGEELNRVREGKKIRAGKGKMRGRRYRKPRGPLLVITADRGIGKAAANISGVDVSLVERLNAELLAPGTHPGRLTVWSESAIKKLEEARLFS
jgi:large subunit ribosomal protein L4e